MLMSCPCYDETDYRYTDMDLQDIPSEEDHVISDYEDIG
jgi:hypothetical protein